MLCHTSCRRRTLVCATSSSTCCATLPAMAPSALCCWSSLPTWRCWIMTAGEKSVCCVEQFAYLTVLDRNSRWERCVLCGAVCLPDCTGSWQQVRKVCVVLSSLPTWLCWVATAGEKGVYCVEQFACLTVLDHDSRWEKCVLCGAVCLTDSAGSQQQVRKACVVWLLDHDGRWEKCVSCCWSSLPTWLVDHNSRWEKCVLSDGARSWQQVRKVCVVWLIDHDSRWEKCVLCDGAGSQQQVRKVCVEQFVYLSTLWQCQVSFTCHHNLTQVTHFLHLDSYDPCCSVRRNEISSSATGARLVIRDMHGVRRVTVNLTHVPVVVTCGIWRVAVNFLNVPVSLICVAFEGWQWTSWMCLYPWCMWHLKGDSEVHQCAYILDLGGIWRVALNFMNAPVSLTNVAFEGWQWTSQTCLYAFQNEAAEVDTVWGDQSDPEGQRWCSQQRQWRVWGEASLSTQRHSKCIEGFICGFIFNPLCKIWVALKCGKFGSPYLGKATEAWRAVLPIPAGVCMCPDWHSWQCLGFLTCTEVLRQMISQGVSEYHKRVCAEGWLIAESWLRDWVQWAQYHVTGERQCREGLNPKHMQLIADWSG